MGHVVSRGILNSAAAPAATITVTNVVALGGIQARFTFSAPITANLMDPADFNDDTQAIPGLNVTQDAANAVIVEFDGAVFVDDVWTLNSTYPGIVTPQTGTMS